MNLIKQIYNFILINYKEFFREPEILFWAFIFPISFALILGIAFTRIPPKKYLIGVTGSKESYISLKDINLNSNLKIEYFSEEEIQNLLKKRKLYCYIKIEKQKLIFYYDKNFQEAKEVYLELLKALYKQKEQFNIQEKQIEILGTRYIDFLVPGLIAMGIMNSALWGIGWNFIQMRIKKILKLLYVSPLNKNAFFFGYIIARFSLSIIENIVLFIIVDYFYNIPFLGSFLDLAIFYSISYLLFASMAILASSRVSSTIAGNGIINAITLPMMILSGIFFDYQGFPDFLVTIIESLPLTLVANGIRGIFIEGITIIELKKEIAFLLIESLIFFYAGKKIFKWN